METTTPAERVSSLSKQTDAPGRSRRETLVPPVGYFLKLGTIGFGGPVALVGFMHRDLVERLDEPGASDAIDLRPLTSHPLHCWTAFAHVQHVCAGMQA